VQRSFLWISENVYIVYTDQYKIFRSLLICNKKTRSSVRNGVFVSQSIFSSSMVIQNGTDLTEHMAGGQPFMDVIDFFPL